MLLAVLDEPPKKEQLPLYATHAYHGRTLCLVPRALLRTHTLEPLPRWGVYLLHPKGTGRRLALKHRRFRGGHWVRLSVPEVAPLFDSIARLYSRRPHVGGTVAPLHGWTRAGRGVTTRRRTSAGRP